MSAECLLHAKVDKFLKAKKFCFLVQLTVGPDSLSLNMVKIVTPISKML